MGDDTDIITVHRDRIEALEAFVQRFIDLGYAAKGPDLDELVELHNQATRLLPHLRRGDPTSR